MRVAEASSTQALVKKLFTSFVEAIRATRCSSVCGMWRGSEVQEGGEGEW